MAQRWVATQWGGPELWQFVDHDVPAPGPGEVTIAVRAAGVNPADYKHVLRERPGVAFPVAIGYEVAGVVTAIGADTRIGSGEVHLGDEVLAFRISGGYATEVTVPGKDVFAKPATVSFEAAANLLLAGATASEMLHVTGAARGETIVVHGASGAVGVSVLQQARLLGVHVVGTASPASFERVRQYGGVPVAYGPGLVERVQDAASGPVEAALDTVGTDEAVDASLELVADRQRIVTIAAPQRAATDGILAIGGTMPASAAYRAGVRAHLIELAASGSLEVPIARTFPLSEAREALAFLAEGHPGGKLALLP